MGISIEAELNTEELRNHRRSRVLLSATLCTEVECARANLLNICPSGAMIDADLPPRVGERVVLIREPLSSEAEVVWVDGHRFGLTFRQPVNPVVVDMILAQK